MAGGDRLTIYMTGGGPWGFRLFGGENDPLVIAKLRKRSKAADAGIREGDVLLGINGYSCKGLNHPTVMALVEQAGPNLTFEVLRGSDSKNAVDAAFQALGSSLQPLSASQIPQQTGPVPEAQHQVPQYEPAPATSQALYNGYSKEGVPLVTSRQRDTFQEGDTTRQVTTETSKQQIGGTTITKVRREEVTHSGIGPGLSPYSVQEQRSTSPNRPPMFQVSDNTTGRQKPGTWTPSGQVHKPVTAPLKVTAPEGIEVEQNPDQSVTISVGGLHEQFEKENIAPAVVPKPSTSLPMRPTQFNQPAPATEAPTFTQQSKPAPTFNVKKAPAAAAPPGTWQPSSVPFKPQPQIPQPAPQVADTPEEPTHFPFDYPTWPGSKKAKDELDAMDIDEPLDPHLMSIHLSKILHEGPGSDYESGNESPGTFWHRKKKIFADSSFYDDPEHKYPTIEEQIKMARKVALSLLSPANRDARGHKMFIKRKQKSIRWSTDFPAHGHGHFEMEPSDEEDEKYFRPNPWEHSGAHTWHPPSLQAPPGGHQPVIFKNPVKKPDPMPAPAPVPHIPTYVPPPPPLPPLPKENVWKAAPVLPKYDTTDSDKTKALSANEIERIRLYGTKTDHTAVPPQMAFSLADDLRKMKGKGGRLFAKRRERAEKWVVGETMGQGDADPNIMTKLILGSGHGPVEAPQSLRAPPPKKVPSMGGMPSNRLQEMIKPPKAKMTPWDAMAEYGDVEKAFDHLDGYLAMKGVGNYKSAVAKNLDLAAQRSYMTPFRPQAKGIPVNTSGPPRMPEFSSKIKPWDSTGPSSKGHSPASSLPTASHTSLPSFSPSSGGGAGSTAGFRPVSFKPSTPAHKAGVFDAGPSLWKKTGDRGTSSVSNGVTVPGPREVSEEMGYCDL